MQETIEDMLRKNIGTTALLTLVPISLLAQERIVDTLRNNPKIIKDRKMVKPTCTVKFPEELSSEVVGASHGVVRARPRYGTYYFDYKFDIPVEYIEPKKDSAIMKGFIVPDTLQHLVHIPDPNSKWKSYKNTPTENFIERFIQPHALKYDQLIYVQMQNPVKVPEYRKPISQVYLIQKTRQEQIEDSIGYSRRMRVKKRCN
jgi:hypothetical protein